MNREDCCICSKEADWVCVREPNAGELNHLCDRHFQALRERNSLLAGRYEAISQDAHTKSSQTEFSLPDQISGHWGQLSNR